MTGGPPAEASLPALMGPLSGGVVWQRAGGVDFIFSSCPWGAEDMKFEMKNRLRIFIPKRFVGGGDNWARTSDLLRVKQAL